MDNFHLKAGKIYEDLRLWKEAEEQYLAAVNDSSSSPASRQLALEGIKRARGQQLWRARFDQWGQALDSVGAWLLRILVAAVLLSLLASAVLQFRYLTDIAEFALLFERWLYEHYLRRPHARLGGSPLEAYRQDYGTPVVPDERSLDLLLLRAEKRLVRRNGLELFERNRWYWSEQLLGREGTYVEVRWDPRELGKVLVYTEEGFLGEAFNLELASFHPSLEQLREYKRMKKLQREIALAHLELMHLAAEGLTALDLVRNSPRRRPARALAGEVALPTGENGEVPVFTSEAARAAWEAEHAPGQGNGHGHS